MKYVKPYSSQDSFYTKVYKYRKKYGVLKLLIKGLKILHKKITTPFFFCGTLCTEK